MHHVNSRDSSGLRYALAIPPCGMFAMSYSPTVMLPVPDARKITHQQMTHDDVRALVRLVMGTAVAADGQRPTQEQVADMLGYSRHTLRAWMRKPPAPVARGPRVRKLPPSSRRIPFSAFYCLQAMAVNPAATALALWGARATQADGSKAPSAQ